MKLAVTVAPTLMYALIVPGSVPEACPSSRIAEPELRTRCSRAVSVAVRVLVARARGSPTVCASLPMAVTARVVAISARVAAVGWSLFAMIEAYENLARVIYACLRRQPIPMDTRAKDLYGVVVSELLVVEGVWKGYSRGGRWSGVLSGVSFGVGRGEVVAVVGSRLEGKTSLLRIAAGMERPDRGSVSLEGRVLAGFSDRSRARLLGHEIVWVDRDGPELGLEVSKFVGWPLALHGRGRRHADEMAARALERVGARECMGRRWGELSNWQRVLVGLARAFAGSPRLVVIDDLLDALGGRATEEASDLLRSLVEESEPRCGVLMSASDMESAMFADRVWSLTREGTLKAMSGQAGSDADIIPFPTQAQADGP